MNVTIKYFASVREMVGTGEERIELPEGVVTVGALRDYLVARGGVWADALGASRSLRMACNQSMCNASTPIAGGAEVAFFPPVTGG